LLNTNFWLLGAISTCTKQ